jgi:hypothetical protein
MSTDRNSAVERGMQRWANEFVIKHTICPFAAKSNYSFHICGDTKVTKETIRFVKQHSLEIGGDSHSSPRDKIPRMYNAFLVFPYVSEFLERKLIDGGRKVELEGAVTFMAFKEVANEFFDGSAGTDESRTARPPVKIMPFHPDLPEYMYKMAQEYLREVAQLPGIYLIVMRIWGVSTRPVLLFLHCTF